jgi:hypothetical protein
MILADMVNDMVNALAINNAILAASTQGGAIELSQGELSLNMVVNVSVPTLANVTSLVVQAEECATTNGTFTLIPNTQVTVTASSASANLQQVVRGLRTLRYARANAITFAAITATGAFSLTATFHELKKISPGKSGADNYPSSSPPLGS